jgi:flavin-dependent dehydrogenase
MHAYDVIVVGARCAGASTAMLLARQGLDVLLVDRATFPSEIPHGHFIHRHGPRRLARWGVLDLVLATGCPPVTSMTLDVGDFPLTGVGLAVDGIPMGLGPRRSRLDRVLVEAAVESGAELRAGFAVDDLLRDGDRVTGIRGRHVKGGATVTEHARVVVGADGRNSGVARRVAASLTLSEPTVACWYFSYWSEVACDALEIHVRGKRAIFAHPTNDGLTAAFVGFPIAELPAVRRDIEGSVLGALHRVPDLAERFRAGRREERFYGAAQMPNFIRRPYGPGWALVGDAGCHKDPYLALGVCDALRDADLVADALADGLGGRRPLDRALADYERRRDESTVPDFHENLTLARFQPPPPEVFRRRAAVRGDQAAINRLFLLREGMIPTGEPLAAALAA